MCLLVTNRKHKNFLIKKKKKKLYAVLWSECWKILFWQTNFPEYQGPEKIVIRRYSDFVWLRDRLFEKYKGIFIPPLPEKSAVGNELTVSFCLLHFIFV